MSKIRVVPPERRYVDQFDVTTDTDGRYLEAVVTTYGDWKDIGPFHERMMPTVFQQSIDRNGDNIKLIVGHAHRDMPAVGTPVQWSQSDQMLHAVWRFGSHKEADAAHQAAAEGMFGGVSVGFQPGKNDGDNEWSPDLKRVTRHNARLLEVSLVVVPANEDAKIVAVRTMGTPTATVTAPWLAEYRKRYPRRG